MRAKMSVPEPPVPRASTRAISDAPSGKQALIRAGKRGATRVTLTSLAAMRSRSCTRVQAAAPEPRAVHL